jgi:glycosyltransferase involved in cell wall biosynthesis
MTRILYIGDAAATGFGTVTAGLGLELLNLGEDVRFICQNMTGDPLPAVFATRTWDANYMGPKWTSVVQEGFGDGWKPEAVIVLGDYATARYVFVPNAQIAAIFKSVPTYHYCPIEGIDLPPAWSDLWDVIKPVAMSKFGQAEMAKVMGYSPPMIYHGVDTADFFPVSPSRPLRINENIVLTSKEACKELLGFPLDVVIAARTDRYMPRKEYNAMFRAMRIAMEQVPKLRQVIHCRPDDQGGNFLLEFSKYSPDYRGRTMLTNAHDTYKGFPRPILNAFYNAADIYLSAGAEGFGLTHAEAIACGTPAVGLDYSATPEVIGPAGLLAPYAFLYDNPYNHLWASPDIEVFAEKVVYLATHPAKRRALGALGPAHVARNFSWKTAAQQFSDLIANHAAEAAA